MDEFNNAEANVMAVQPDVDVEELCGCMPSHIDGTEHVINADDKVELPSDFTWQYAMPPVRDQGNTQTCVCQTLVSMLDFVVNTMNGTPNVTHDFSITELYNARANKRLEGMSIKEAMHYLRHTGLGNKGIAGYAKLNSVQAVKYALLLFGPVASGFKCYSGDYNKFWQKKGRYCGGHCITLVGYNKTGFVVRNSWGTKWGNNGYLTIPYSEFKDAAFESWTFTI